MVVHVGTTMIPQDDLKASTGADGTDLPLETFERAPAPATGPTAGPRSATGPTLHLRPSQLVYPPGRSEEVEKERERRRLDLDGDEELARQLAAQLMLTSPAEHEASSNDERLPRVGDCRAAENSADAADAERDRQASMEYGNYGVEYHALESDGEDHFSQRAGQGGLCHVLTSLIFGKRKPSAGQRDAL
mmetsp:Transcript_36232/g.71596  ORF Transcript_36232/g.71596 Transcript_36232/m.71596 type:complete len:190 (+) Transcript_36232:24-593(+)